MNVTLNNLSVRVAHRAAWSVRLIFILFLAPAVLRAAQLKEAKVTRVVNEVKLLPGAAAPKPAAINDDVRDGTAVRTGVDSRSELTFSDQTLARLGANTIFSFTEGTRSMDLGGGAMLLRVPKDAGGAKINTAAVTAAITGTTVMMQYDAKGVAKFIVLEGTACLSLKNTPDDCVPVKAGQLLVVPLNPPPTSLSAPIDIDLQKLAETSNLLSTEFGSLASLDLIQQAIQNQEQLKSANAAAETNAGNNSATLFAALSEMTTAVDQRTAVQELTSPTPSPTSAPVSPTPSPVSPTPSPVSPTPRPSPSKFGPPSAITSANLSTVDSASVIQTDPSITRNGETGYGTIFRSSALDGSLATFLFGTTSSFDSQSGFAAGPDTAADLAPIALFKFTTLQLAGNPTVSTANGGMTKLGLVGVNGITTGGAGANLTFTGIDTLLLATQNGSINLGPEISLDNVDRVFIYARGANSSLTISSAINAANDLHLYSQGSVALNGNLSTTNFSSYSGGDFNAAGLITAGNISITALGDLNFGAANFSPAAFADVPLVLDAAGTLTIDARANQTILNQAGSIAFTGETVSFLADNPFKITFNLSGPSAITAGAGGINASGIDFFTPTETALNLVSAGSITAHSIGTNGSVIGSIAANGGSLTLIGTTSTFYTLLSAEVSALTSIDVGGNAIVTNITAGTTINVNGLLSAFGTISAGGNITATTLDVSEGGVITPASVIAGNGGIRPFVVGPGGAAKNSFISADSIISPSGIDFSGNQFDGIDGLSSGGRLTLNARTLLFDANGGIGSVNFNGADVSGFPNGGPTAAGDGGIFLANASGDITVNSVIEATSGLQDANSAPTGNGGKVLLHSTAGEVSVNSLIEVSANDNTRPALIHRSASGGSLTITSERSDGVAINVGSSAQLLSLLNAAASGPGGEIVLLASGGSSSIAIDNRNGAIVADRGLIDIRQTGSFGAIDLSNADLAADIIKLGALGANGTLTITGGAISADTLLRLYAGGSNGAIIFAANVSLTSGSTAALIAAHSVTINSGIMVTIGGQNPASVFTDLANYTGSGGNNSTTGMFAGAGATTAPFASAPPFDSTAGAQLITYSSAANGNWSDPTVWNPMVVPNNGNLGRNYDAVINGGTLTQDITAGVTIEQLFMNGGTLNLTSPLRLNAGLQLTGGAINNGTLNLAGVSNQSAVFGASSLTINNASDYQIALNSGNAFTGGNSIFNNTGSLRRTAGTGGLSFNLGLNNTGTVSSESGIFSLSGGGLGSGQFAAASGATLEFLSDYSLTNGARITGAGLVRIANNQSLTVSGTIANSGNFAINSTGNYTDLILAGDTTFSGAGTFTLSNAARVRGSGILTNAGNNIVGETSNSGSFGANEIGIVNQASGVIDANVSGLVLLVDPNSANGLTNQGILRASGGGLLRLTGNGGGLFTNTGGTIVAQAGSEVQLTSGASITGGLLNTAGSGVIRTLDTATLTSLTNAGSFRVSNNTTLTLSGLITNTGTLILDSTGNYTDVLINDNVTLTGGGLVNLQNAARIRGGGTLFIGGSNGEIGTVQGETSNSGSLGANELAIVNRSGGLVNANVSGLPLVVDPRSGDGFVNQGLLRASGGGLLQLTGNGNGTFFNSGGTIQALDGSQVQLIGGVLISGGTLATSGTGSIHNVNSATLDSLRNTGSFIADNNTTTTLTGTLSNTGSFLLNSTGNYTDLIITGNVTLTGGSALTLQNAARVLGAGTLFNGGPNGETFTIQGETNNSGSLGANQLAIVNRSGGLIDANVAVNGNGLNLVVDPSGAVDLINLGTMRASNGGILLLTGNGGGAFNNTGGIIEALNGSQVQLTAGALITGGTLRSTGTGGVYNLSSTTLANLTNAGRFIANNNTTTSLSGTITNSGSINLNSAGNYTDLTLLGNVTLTGGGQVNLTNADRVRGTGNLTNVNNIIRGETNNSGSLGTNEIGLVNQSAGIIDANVNGLALILDPNAANGLSNAGILRSTNGGILRLTGNGGGAFDNTSGSVVAYDLSQVQLTSGASLIGGLWQTQGTGTISVVDSATLSNLTLGGNFSINNTSTATFAGTITNAGNISIVSQGNYTDLALSGNVTLNGAGRLYLQSAARVRGSGILTNASTIQGETSNSGSLGTNEIGIVNQAGALIDANANGLYLDVDPNSANGLANQGTMRASNGGILVLNGNGGGTFSNTGTIAAVSNGILRFNGTVNSSGTVDVGANTLTATGNYTQTGGSFLLAGGSVQSSSPLIFNGGLLDARGTITAAIQNNAILRPALGGNGLNVTGNISLLSSSQLVFQLGGITQGTQYGYLNVAGNVSLGGQLVLSFANSFVAAQGDSFTVLNSTEPLSGSFANIASGARLNTSDSSGSFLVSYTGNNLVLSNFTLAGAHILSTWTGSTGNWSSATNWDTNPRYPNNGQPNAGDLYDAVLSNGGTITLDVPITIQKFTLSSGTVTGPSDLTLNELFAWTGGAMSGSGVTNANGGLVFGNVNLDLFGRTLNLAAGQTAVLNSANGYLRLFSGGVINNAGVFLAQNNQSLTLGGGSGNVFNNSGTFNRDTATGTFASTVPFNNSGVVNVATGTLALSGGDSGSTSGAFNVSSGAALNLGGNFTLAANSAVAGSGSVGFNNGTITVGGSYNVMGATLFNGAAVTFSAPVANLGSALTISAGAVSFNSNDLTFSTANFSGGSLNGTANITATGLFNWAGGSMGGTGVTNANGGLLFGNTNLDLFGRTLNLAAGQTTTLSSASGYLRLFNGGVINNAGLFLAENNQSLTLGGGSGNVFNNTGTFTRDTGTGTFTSTVPFNNSGVVNVATGTLALSGGDSGSTSGSFNISSGANLNFGGNFTLPAGSAVAGAGSVGFNNGTIALGGSYNVTGSTLFSGATVTFSNPITSLGSALTISAGAVNFNSNDLTFSTANFSGGSLNGTANITTTGLFTWGGGSMSGSGVTNANGGLLFGNTNLDLFGRTLNLAAGQTATLSSANGYLRLFNGGVINNAGLFLAENDQSLTLGGGSGNAFNNSGTFTRDIGTGTFTSTVPFNNSGVVNVATGTLAFNGGYTQTAGSLNLSGGTLSATSALQLQSGLLTGFGNLNAAITNSGMIRPGLGGALNVNGNVSLLSASQLIFQLGGLTQGTQYGYLNVAGNVSLGGQLVLSFVNGFQNSVSGSNAFTLLNSTALSGSFSNITSGSRLLTSGGEGSFVVIYSGNTLTLSSYLSGAPSMMVGANWLSAASGNWTTPANWSSNPNYPNNGTPPNTFYDAVIAATGAAYTVTLDAPVTVQSWTLNSSNATLSLTNNAVLNTVNTSSIQAGTLLVNGGAVRGGTLNIGANGSLLFVNNSGNRFDGVLVNGDFSLGTNQGVRLQNNAQISGNVTLAGDSSVLALEESSILNTALTVNLDAANSPHLSVEGNNTPTLGANVLVRGAGSIGDQVLFGGTNSLTNLGTITADRSGLGLSIVANTFTNSGTLNASSGGVLNLLSPTWSNTGTINANSSVVNLGGTYTSAGLGTLHNNSGVINITGTLDNTGATYTLPAVLTLNGGRILGGTLNIAPNGSALLFANNSGNRFDGVLVNGNFSLGTNQGVRLQNNAQIAGTVNLSGDSSVLALEESNTLNTALTVNLDAANSPHLSVEGNSTPTLGANVVVRGAGSIGDQVLFGGTNSLTNQGTITADRSGLGLSILSNTFTNQGALSATSGGILNLLSPNWSNSGTITANNGIVNFGGSFSSAGLGTVTNTNGTFNITGTFNNTGATYTLPATFTLNGGRIVGGTLNVAPNGSALLFANNSGNRFDGVLINGNLSLGTNQGVRLQNNAQIAGTVSLSGDSSVLAIEESSTLNTALTINLDATNSPHLSVEGNNTPTLGVNVVVRGVGSIGDQVLFGGTNSLTNQGKITADRSGLSLNIQPNSFTNQGSLNASGGAILNLLASTWMSSGTITATNATVNLGGTFTSAGLGTLNSNNGVFNITGTLDNTGATYSLPTVLTLNGGRILGGTLNVAPNGSALLFANNSGNRFDGVLINGNLSLGTNQGVRLQNGAQINGSVSLSGDSSVLAMEESNTLTGLTVNMDAANSPHFSVEGNNSATLGASVLVRGAGSIGDQVLFGGTNSLTNQGTITADRSGLTLQILSATFANQGTVQATNSGTLTISSPNWSNPSGTLGVNNGTLNLGGTFTSPGTINRTGGTINITGTWNNTGNTYTLNSTTGDLRLNGGTIRGGQINQSGGALGFSSSSTNLLDGVTTSGTLQLSEASSFVRLGSGTSFSQADLTGSNSHLVIEGTSGTNPAFNTTLSGALINLNASNAVFGLSGNINLTLGASSTVRGQGFIFADQFFSGNGVLINQGTIVADVSGQTLATSVDGLTNQGTMRANAGATLNLNTLTQTAGTLDTTGGTIAGNTLNIQGGTLSGYGLISLQNGISNNATLRPSLGATTGLRVTGSVSLLASSSLVFQLGGLTQGTQYTFLNVNGNVSLGGQLAVSFVNSFQAANANSFTVLSSTAPLTGTFANVASGGRLEASNAAGSFLVTYTGSNITLTDYTPDPPKPARIVPGNNAGESRLLAEQRPAFRTGQTLSQRVLDEPLVAPETSGKGGRMTVIKAESSSQLLSLLEAAPAPKAGRRVNVKAPGRLAAAKLNSPSNNPAQTANRPALSQVKSNAPRSGNDSPVSPARLRD